MSLTRDSFVTPRAAHEGDLFAARALMFLSGVTYRQIDYYVGQRVLRPTVAASGSGGPDRQYSLAEAFIARLLKILAEHGTRMPRMRAVLTALEENPTLWDEVVVIVGDFEGRTPGGVYRHSSTVKDGLRVDLIAVQLGVRERHRLLQMVGGDVAKATEVLTTAGGDVSKALRG